MNDSDFLDIRVKETQTERMWRVSRSFRNSLPFARKKTVCVSVSIENHIHVFPADEFDALVEFFFVEQPEPGKLFVRLALARYDSLIKSGFMEFIVLPGVVLELDLPVQTSCTVGTVHMTERGKRVIASAGLVVLTESAMRLELFGLLKLLVDCLGVEHLPAFLTHEDKRVRDIGCARLGKE